MRKTFSLIAILLTLAVKGKALLGRVIQFSQRHCMTGFQKRERVVFEVGLCFPGIPHVSHTPHPRWSLRITYPRPLIAVFAMLPDFRKPRGKRCSIREPSIRIWTM